MSGPNSSVSSLDSSEGGLSDSVRRSRKRFLSPGLLRGDKVSDRLRIQEVSASPFLKKKRQDGGMALTEEVFKNYLQDKIETRFDSLEAGQNELKRSVGGLEKAVASNSCKLDKHEALIKDNQREVAQMRKEIDEIKDGKSRWPALPSPSARLHIPGPDLDEYLTARRSLRLWPVAGTTPKMIWKSTGDFLHLWLHLPSIGEELIENISRPAVPSAFGVKDEAVILFKSATVRDSVIGASAKLAGRIDDNGQPTAGIRLEIPGSLKEAFGVLRKFGQVLRTRHGTGLKRHVKFDDNDRSLFLNVKLPGDNSWSRVDLDLARKGIATRRRAESDDLEARFDLLGQPVAPANRFPRPASTSTPASTSNNPWTGRRAVQPS